MLQRVHCYISWMFQYRATDGWSMIIKQISSFMKKRASYERSYFKILIPDGRKRRFTQKILSLSRSHGLPIP